MLESLRQVLEWRYRAAEALAEKYAVIILAAVLTTTAFQKVTLILHTDGGGDLLGADIPKSLMLVTGQNPYLTNPWASPYPPFLLFVVGGIARLTTGNVLLNPVTIGLISQHLRVAGVAADALVALLVFYGLRSRGAVGFTALVPSVLFLALPSISLSPYYWFNSDVFGYPILACSVLALIKRHYLVGSMLLATATIFKIHPILSVVTVTAWLIRNQGWKRSLPSISASGSILSLGLVLPSLLPGYLESVLGFNLASGFGAGTSSFTLMNLFYDILPSFFQFSLPMGVENQIWLAMTTAIFVAVLVFVWSRARELTPVDVVALGLLAWMIPLRQIYTHYLVWAIVPFLMRGRLRQTLVVGVLLELANTMASWSWDLSPDPFPVLATGYGFFATSLVYFSCSLAALVFIVREKRSLNFLNKVAGELRPIEECPILHLRIV